MPVTGWRDLPEAGPKREGRTVTDLDAQGAGTGTAAADAAAGLPRALAPQGSAGRPTGSASSLPKAEGSWPVSPSPLTLCNHGPARCRIPARDSISPPPNVSLQGYSGRKYHKCLLGLSFSFFPLHPCSLRIIWTLVIHYVNFIFLNKKASFS